MVSVGGVIKRDHNTLYILATHPKRRAILLLLLRGAKTLDELSRHLDLPEDKINYHLGMLSQIGFIEAKEEAYGLTENGAKFTKNI